MAVSLATTGNEPAALQRALDHLAADVDGYIAEGTSDPAGRLSWLILLVDATGGDPAGVRRATTSSPTCRPATRWPSPVSTASSTTTRR